MKKLGELLVSEGLVSATELDKALDLQRRRGGRLGSALVRLGFVTEHRIRATLASKYGIPIVDLATRPRAPEAIRSMSRDMVEDYGVFPVSLEGKRLTVAVADPTDVSVLDELRFATGCEVVPVLASETDIRAAIEAGYPTPAGDDKAQSRRPVVKSGTGNDDVGMLLDNLVANAIRSNANEIHLEPRSEGLDVRYRNSDGFHSVLHTSSETQDALVARLRALCYPGTAENVGSQSGELSLHVKRGGQ